MMTYKPPTLSETERAQWLDWAHRQTVVMPLYCSHGIIAFDAKLRAVEAERDALAAKLAEAEAECDRRFPHDEHYEQLNDALAQRDAAIRERDEARANGKVLVEANKRHFDTAVAIAAERDALTAARNECERQYQAKVAELIAAIARAEDAESRAAALASALRSIAANTCCGTCQEAALVARAALAANGTTTTAGEGWIACSEQMPEDSVLVLLLHQCPSWGREPWKHTIGQVVDDGETWAWADEDDTVQDWELVTHWMPLPAPPTANDKETTA